MCSGANLASATTSVALIFWPLRTTTLPGTGKSLSRRIVAKGTMCVTGANMVIVYFTLMQELCQ
jgi:hypothetical protein